MEAESILRGTSLESNQDINAVNLSISHINLPVKYTQHVGNPVIILLDIDPAVARAPTTCRLDVSHSQSDPEPLWDPGAAREDAFRAISREASSRRPHPCGQPIYRQGARAGVVLIKNKRGYQTRRYCTVKGWTILICCQPTDRPGCGRSFTV